MTHSLPSDIELVKKVKENNDNDALKKLTERHTGLYLSICRPFFSIAKNETYDIIDSKYSIVYDAVMRFDPNKNMKFHVYLAERIRYTCMHELTRKNRRDNRYVSIHQGDDECDNKDCDYKDFGSYNFDYKDIETIKLEDNLNSISKNLDKKFYEIMSMRIDGNSTDSSLMPFSEIAKKMGLSAVYVRDIFKKNLQKIRKNKKLYEELLSHISD